MYIASKLCDDQVFRAPVPSQQKTLCLVRPVCIWDYFTMNSLTLFGLAESVQWIFEISARDVITAYCTIIMYTQGHGLSCHLWPQCMISKGDQVNFARFVLLAVSERAETWLPSFCIQYKKTIIRFGFCDIQNNQGRGNGYQPQPSASADNP